MNAAAGRREAIARKGIATELVLLAALVGVGVVGFIDGDDGVMGWLSIAALVVLVAVFCVSGIGNLRGRWRSSAGDRDATAQVHSLASARYRIDALLATGATPMALQPVVDLTSGRLAGVEALARFNDGRDVGQWFQDAQDTGRTLALEQFLFRCGLCTLDALPADCYLALNATPQLLTEGSMLRELAEGDFPLDRLVIEITEHAKVGDYEQLHALLVPIRERGVRLAVDDTGAGYASFTHVLQLRPDIIKIDRSLVTGIGSDAARRSLLTALILLALDLGASVTAEGVETPQELETLATLGVDNVQGFLTGRPSTDPRRWKTWQDPNWLDPRVLPGRAAAAMHRSGA